MEEQERREELEGYAKAKKLHEQLERSGAYEKLKNRRGAQLLRAYLLTQDSLAEANQTLEKPYSSDTSAGAMLTYTMRQAFPLLDEQTRLEYGTPEAALQPRTQAGLIRGGRRGHAAIIEAYHEGTYTGKQLGGRREPGAGKTIGRPRKSGNTPT